MLVPQCGRKMLPGGVQGEKTQKWSQCAAVIIASITAILAGCTFAWTSPSIPILVREGHITEQQSTIILAIGPVGCFFSTPLASVLADRWGRKPTLLFGAIPYLLAILMFMNFSTVYPLCLARILAAIGESGTYVALPMFTGEVCEPSVRGRLGTCSSTCQIFGILFVNIIGSYLTIRQTASVLCVFPVLFVALFATIHESPYYHLMRNDADKARKALIFFRRTQNVDQELTMLKADVKRQMSERGQWRDLFTIETNRKAITIMLGLRAIQQLTGISTFGLYMQTILQEAGGIVSGATASIILLSVQLSATFLFSLFLDKYAKKRLLVVSAVGCGLSLAMVSVYLVRKELHCDIGALGWMPLVGMTCYIISFAAGLGLVPNVMLGELFSTSIKAKAVCINYVFYALSVTTIVQVYQFTSLGIGQSAPFLLFAGCSFLSVVFALLCVPETKGRTLEAIQMGLRNQKEFAVAT